MIKVLVTDGAAAEIDSIFDYGAPRYGETATREYVTALINSVAERVNDPTLQSRPVELVLNLDHTPPHPIYALRHLTHFVLYTLDEHQAVIIAIQHARSDTRQAISTLISRLG